MNPIPLCMCAVENTEHAITINGGVADLHPSLGFFLVKWGYASSTSCAHCHVYWATRIDGSVYYIPRSQVGVNVPSEYHVNVVLGKEGFQVQFGSEDLRIVPM